MIYIYIYGMSRVAGGGVPTLSPFPLPLFYILFKKALTLSSTTFLLEASLFPRPLEEEGDAIIALPVVTCDETRSCC